MSTIAERLALAVHHHQSGRLAEAEGLYRGILDEEPGQAHALHLLGVLAHQRGRPQEAIDLIGRALAAQGPHAVFHSNLGAAYLAAGRLADAAAQCREAIRLRPDTADAHFNLGLAQRGQGQLDDAESEFRQAIRLNPRHLDARCNFGAVLQQQGKLAEALSVLQETVRLAPGHAQAHNDLGGVLLACGQPESAAAHLREAIRLKPDFAQAHSNLGAALEDLNHFDEAMACFRESLRLNPGYASAHNNLGSVLQAQGRMDEALAEFHEALRLDPNNAMVISHLSKLAAVGKYRFSAEQIEAIKQSLAGESLALDSRCRLHFTLAQVFDKAGSHDEAFEHACRGNEVRRELCLRRGVVFDPEAHGRFVARLSAVFTSAYFERVRPFGVDSELPIFIVGMPRSGTTLAEQVLASHPQVHGAGELEDMDRLSQTMPQHLGISMGYPECLAWLDAGTARTLALDHLHKLRQLSSEAARVVDKFPVNFLHLGIIATLFPKARIVHCRRDPIDTCLSCFFLNFGTRLPFALDLRHLGRYYREYERLMAHWAQVLPLPIFDLDYEELTADQESASRRLIEFCGLPWDERCLRFFDSQRVVRTPSTLQVRQPMYRSAVGRWKPYEAHLQPLLDELAR